VSRAKRLVLMRRRARRSFLRRWNSSPWTMLDITQREAWDLYLAAFLDGWTDRAEDSQAIRERGVAVATGTGRYGW
jgi:hypothetical protein